MPIQLEGSCPLLQVYDMPTSLYFYRDLLGFDVKESAGPGDDVDWVLLQHGDINLMLNTAYEKPARPAEPDQMRQASHADTMIYFGCPDVDKAFFTLKEGGVQLAPPIITGYGWKAVHFKDPDGYMICLHWPMDE